MYTHMGVHVFGDRQSYIPGVAIGSSKGPCSVWHSRGHQEEASGNCEVVAQAVCVLGHNGD